MQEAKLYDELAKHLDQGIVGSPRSPALIEILKILFPGEEAEVGVRLPMQDQSLAELRERALAPSERQLFDSVPEGTDSSGPIPESDEATAEPTEEA